MVGGIPTPLKNMTSSVGMMKFPIYGKMIQMLQTTNQYQVTSENTCVLHGNCTGWGRSPLFGKSELNHHVCWLNSFPFISVNVKQIPFFLLYPLVI